jgi:hypothetical protein
MISLTTMPTEDDGRLVRCNPKTDSGGAIVWDVEIAFEVSSEEEASLIEDFVPGTFTSYRCGKYEGGKGRVSASGNFDIVRALFELDGNQLAEAHSEIRQCVVSVNGENAVLLVKMRVHGLLPEPASRLAYALDEVLTVKLESRNVQLFTPAFEEKAEPTDQEPAPKEEPSVQAEAADLSGCVVDIGGYVGLVVKEEDGRIELDVLDDKYIEVSRPDVVETRISVLAPDGEDLSDVLQSYIDAADKQEIKANWADIIEAIGVLYAEGGIQAIPRGKEFAWTISETVTSRAISIASSKDGSFLGIEAEAK